MSPSLIFLLVGGQNSASTPNSQVGRLTADETYAYRSPSFNRFVADSYQSSNGPSVFYKWFESSYRKKHFAFPDRKNVSLTKYLAFKSRDLSHTKSIAQKVEKERKFAASIFALVKEVVPKFSLDQGFEFKNTVEHGQRQCFLQSVLISGLLQRGGVPAGVAMVNRNIEGQETNNKHAIAFARLANGHDLIVDASEDTPFARQQGLFVDSTGGYKFVRPEYSADSSIQAYHGYRSGALVKVSDVRPLPRRFIVSQFDYYRGERTVGGVMAKNKTAAGLALAEKYLAKSVAEEPENPLSEYMLGRVDLYRRMKPQASEVLERALSVYEREGWIPPDEKLALGLAGHIA